MDKPIKSAVENYHIESFFNLEPEKALFHVAVIILAYLIALPVGMERSRTDIGLGFRTVSLVSVACCALSLIAFDTFDDQNAQAKMLYGVLTGIGFIGGGALFKSNDGVFGTASAASVWTAAAIGIAVSISLIEIALILSAISTATLYFGSRPKHDSDLKK